MRGWLDALHEEARRVLPAPMAAYVDAGAREEVTLREATAAWSAYRLLPRVLRDVSAVSTATTLLASPVRTPVAVAPTSMQRAAHPEGERAMAAGAAAAGALHVVSSNAGFAFSDIAPPGPWWLQLYVPPEREAVEPLLDAAVAAGASAVALTVDTPVPGTKYAVRDDDWAGLDRSWHRTNLQGRTAVAWTPALVPDDIGWLRLRSGLPVVVKGVLRADDARVCVEAGADAVYVSNHGGRQLDRVVATAHALAAVVDEVGGEVEVYVDGGIRSGLDVFTALALGARAVLVGRPALWGLAADGAAGVQRVLETLSAELVECLGLAGCPRPEDAVGTVSKPGPSPVHPR